MKVLMRPLATLIILKLLFAGSASAAQTDAPKFDAELSKQQQIYLSRGEQRPEGYVIDRTLESYVDALSPDFEHVLASLGANDRWLDIGAGAGQAVLDYLDPAATPANTGLQLKRQKASVVAISIEDRRAQRWHDLAAVLGPNQIRYLFDKRFGQYGAEELGKFRLISDVIGGFSYTDNVSVFMEKVLNLLQLNGSFFTVLQDVHGETATNAPFYKGAPYLTRIENPDGSELKVCSWLKSIDCVEVTCELKTRWKPPIETYRVRKTCDAVKVPELAPVHFEAGTPPERSFRLLRR